MIITVFNNKGGVGKTTLSINLGAALAKMGKRVLLIDTDAQANLTTGLGIDPLEDVEYKGKLDIGHLLIDPDVKLKDVVINKSWDNVRLSIVPGHIRLFDEENSINQLYNRDMLLASKLENDSYSYKNDYDIVFIDSPPALGVMSNIGLSAASAVMIPVQLQPYSIRALEYVLKRLINIQKFRQKPLPVLGIAITIYNPNSTAYNSQMMHSIEILLERLQRKELPILPENTWVPQLNIVSKTSSETKAYPLSFAQYDNLLTSNDKSSAERAFEAYKNIASYILSQNLVIG